MPEHDHICPECGEAVDPVSSSVVAAIEQRLVAGGDLPEVRQFVDGDQHYCHEDHVPRDGLYRIVADDGHADA
jgi:hypothetical protein